MYQQYIGGKLVTGLGKPLDVLAPSTGEVVGTVGSADAAAVAFKTWSKTPLQTRIDWMLKLREACLAERETLVELVSRESGRTYALACGDFDWCMTSFQYYAEEVKRVYGTSFPNAAGTYGSGYHIVERRPMGVSVGHLAWNYPLGNAGLKIAPAVVSSSIPKLITLIGSSETGLQIMREGATSVKKYSFELGGNAPVIVMPDVDLDEVAANIVAKKTGFAGQTCVNYNRIYVQERIYPQLCEKVAEKLRAVKLGRWKDEGQVMGPLINKKARDRMLELVADAVSSGAKLVMGGEVPEEFAKGAYMTPALLVDVTDDMRVSKEEIFGPIIPMQPFKTLDEAIEKANNTIYGLSSYFFGHNAKEISKAFEGMEAGEIFINGSGGTEQTPHAGVKQSGVGCDKSPWSLEEYFDFKYCAMIP